MIRQTFVINGQNFAPVVTNISYLKEVTFEQVITTMDGTEHAIGRRIRPIIEFEVMLGSGSAHADYQALTAAALSVTWTDPDLGLMENKAFRLDCNLDKAFQIRNCVDGLDYYSSGTIRIRALEVF